MFSTMLVGCERAGSCNSGAVAILFIDLKFTFLAISIIVWLVGSEIKSSKYKKLTRFYVSKRLKGCLR